VAFDATRLSILVYGTYLLLSRQSKWTLGKSPSGCCKKNRVESGKNPTPTYGIIDSQSVKTLYDSEERGFDGGKKVKGRKRHIVVDTVGNLLAVVVHAANTHDTVAGIQPAIQAFEAYPTIEKFCADAGYRGTFEVDVFWEMALGVDISERIKPTFEVLPKRWVVERTFAWLGYSRRLSKDYELSTNSAENMIRLSHLHTLLRRLT